MTQVTPEQQRLETAAKSVAAKLQAFRDGLTTDEQQVLSLAFSAMASTGSDEDVAGYSGTDPIGEVRDWCLTWQPRWPVPGYPYPQLPRIIS